VFTPVHAKHTKSFNLGDTLSVDYYTFQPSENVNPSQRDEQRPHFFPAALSKTTGNSEMTSYRLRREG
jgi:hypothetical protein